jgi:hypothetical protein
MPSISSVWFDLDCMKKLILLLQIILLSAACSSAPDAGTPPLLKVTLKPIIDKATAQPLSTNSITCTWYSGKGEVIKTEKYQDRDSLELSVVGDGETRLEVLVESPGYEPWTLGFRTKLKKNKVVVTTVEMVRKGVQGMINRPRANIHSTNILLQSFHVRSSTDGPLHPLLHHPRRCWPDRALEM